MPRIVFVLCVAALVSSGCCARRQLRPSGCSPTFAAQATAPSAPANGAYSIDDRKERALAEGSDAEAAAVAEELTSASANSRLVDSLAKRLRGSGEAAPIYSVALVRIGCASISALSAIADDGSGEARKWAIDALGDLHACAGPSVPVLIRALDASDAEVVAGAIRTLDAIGESALSAQPALAKLAQRTSGEVHQAAILAIAHLSRHGAPRDVARFMMTALTTDEDPMVRAGVATAAREMKEGYSLLVPALLTALKDADDGVRVEAALSAVALGQDRAAAEAILSDVNLDTSPPRFAMRIGDALRSSTPAGARIALRAYARASSATSPRDRLHVVDALLSLAWVDATQIKALLKRLEGDPDEGVREGVAAALGALE